MPAIGDGLKGCSPRSLGKQHIARSLGFEPHLNSKTTGNTKVRAPKDGDFVHYMVACFKEAILRLLLRWVHQEFRKNGGHLALLQTETGTRRNWPWSPDTYLSLLGRHVYGLRYD